MKSSYDMSAKEPDVSVITMLDTSTNHIIQQMALHHTGCNYPNIVNYAAEYIASSFEVDEEAAKEIASKALWKLLDGGKYVMVQDESGAYYVYENE